jgi:hypothetical protein
MHNYLIKNVIVYKTNGIHDKKEIIDVKTVILVKKQKNNLVRNQHGEQLVKEECERMFKKYVSLFLKHYNRLPNRQELQHPPDIKELKKAKIPSFATYYRLFNCCSIYELYEQMCNIPHPLKQIEKSIQIISKNGTLQTFEFTIEDVAKYTNFNPRNLRYWFKIFHHDSFLGYDITCKSNKHNKFKYKAKKK